MSTRKRRGGAANSRQAQKRAREAAPTPVMALETEPIELVESAGDEIVDLTCESLEPVVVDLTHNDSVVIVDERRRPRRNTRRQRQDHADSCVVSSDDEELSRDRDVYVTTHTPRNSREETSPGLRVWPRLLQPVPPRFPQEREHLPDLQEEDEPQTLSPHLHLMRCELPRRRTDSDIPAGSCGLRGFSASNFLSSKDF
ncbi:E3 ubiquitin-protein ligase RNF4 isoform X1 [Myotis myotis]|uniref:E3 ubiquitin-protein ligase RNF4 isoform X1 n=1 Tax=Myotis myotis TaxID=51298 RepID=UPI00174A991F|nr:E3 ubiquitin-protein ligase RNF4 isoform X1 [Myotis myotis]XP_036182860.1 E3 ubiquitin-protein ligase RNF4 isoform X1 [Myotis myotis]XP_036182861.1 E3 ubiquitin-protein ligase RNF4 isoform X1 [Myotis myotis]XP_036182862.1 E3 ubiquitin-protein ligase RNF4 isoform X1 [Myotis myotis]